MPENQRQPETITLTIDGQEVTVPKGTTLLHAAESIGKKIPHYCYHPALSKPAMCRLCLVEVEGWPRMAPSCATEATEGMVVHTESEKALGMRTGVLEFYLLNHPLDCPICDQSGECKLQNFVFEEGREHGRGREPKRVFGRDDFGGDVLFYGDRCVMCTRCVRFMREVAGDERLTIVERGDRAIIDTFFEEGLEGSPYAGNIVDICPVGALVSKDFLYKARAWDLEHTDSICPNCSQGCNISLHTRDNLIQRLKPRENLAVNGYWMCDYGRLNYEWINRGDRLEVPLVKQDGDSKATGWGEALEALFAGLGSVSGPVKAVVSARSSNEDLGILAALVDRMGGGDILYRSVRAADEVPLPGFPSMARRKELDPNVKGAETLGFVRVGGDDGSGGLEEIADHAGVLIAMGDALADQDDSFGAKADLFIYLGTHSCAASANAHFVLPLTTFAEQEGTFTNVQGRVQRFWPALKAPGAALPAWFALGALLAQLTEEEAPRQAARAFELVASRVEAFADMRYETIGIGGALMREPAQISGD